MVRLAPWLAAVSIIAPAVGARAAEPTVLQAAVRLPSIQLNAGVGFSPRTGLVDVDETGPPEAAIAKIQAALKGDASDASRYRTLGAIQAGRGQLAQSKQAYTKAVELFDVALKQSPDDGALLAGKGDALAGKDDLASAERFLRAEAKRLPQAWQVSAILGRVLRQRSFWAFWPGKEVRQQELHTLMVQQGPAFGALTAVRLRSAFPTVAQWEAAEGLLDQADSAFDAAIKAAPGNPEPYAERMAHRFSAAPLAITISNLGKLEGKPDLEAIEAALPTLAATSQAAMLDPETLSDARKVAELRKNDPQAWGVVAGLGRMITGVLTEAGKDSTPAVRNALFARFEALNGLREKARGELERLASSATASEAGAALDALSLLLYQEGDMAGAEATLRKAVTVDPDRTQPWELLAGLLISKGQVQDAATLYEGQLKRRDSTRARLVLAKLYERLGKLELVEAHLAAALTLNAADPSTLTYSAAYALRKQGAAGVSKAEQQLSAAEKILESMPNKADTLNIKYVRAAILVVQDKPEAARRLLAEVLKEDEGHSPANALNAALK